MLQIGQDLTENCRRVSESSLMTVRSPMRNPVTFFCQKSMLQLDR